MTPRTAATAGALLAGLAVALGAFGAHALEGMVLQGLVPEERLSTFETGVRYQMYHGLGMLAAAALGTAASRAAPWLLAGSLVFSGSLYLLVLSGAGWWGAVAPVGGVLQIVGWIVLALAAYRRDRDQVVQ